MFELLDPDTRAGRTILDLACPQGMQEGLSQPVPLLIDEDAEVKQLANAAGFRFFTDPEGSRAYVQHDILGIDPVAVDGAGE